MLHISRYLLLGTLIVAGGCQASPDPPDPVAEAALEHEADTTSAQGSDSSHAGHAADEEPQPLLSIMMGMSVDMTGLMQALWLEDHAALAERARHLAEHAPISEAEVARIASVLGADMEAFEAADATVHDAAVRMSRAAEAGDIERVLDELATVQRGCVACHTQFRDRLRTTPR